MPVGCFVPKEWGRTPVAFVDPHGSLGAYRRGSKLVDSTFSVDRQKPVALTVGHLPSCGEVELLLPMCFLDRGAQ